MEEGLALLLAALSLSCLVRFLSFDLFLAWYLVLSASLWRFKQAWRLQPAPCRKALQWSVALGW